MTVIVTGATGFIGSRLTQLLVARGHRVLGTYRQASDHARLKMSGVIPINCDLSNVNSLVEAMNGCEVCFHLAALARPWSKDPQDFFRINVDGTAHVFAAALQHGVKRVVFTSTASIFGPAKINHAIDETSNFHDRFDTPYEQSKRQCETVVQDYRAKGLDVVTVYPSRVFGPGALHPSNSLTRIFSRFILGNWRWIPGNGRNIANYAFVDDVANGHLLAWENGIANSGYLLGGENLSFNEMFQTLRDVSCIQRKMFHVPKSLLKLFANGSVLKATITHQPPAITPAFVDKYLKDWCLNLHKAKAEIGYEITPFCTALKQTIAWIRESET